MTLADVMRQFELKPPRWVAEDGILVERIMSGEPMSADKRKTLPLEGGHGQDPQYITTGTNGFLDFRTVGVMEAYGGYLEDVHDEGFVAHTAIQLVRIGIEPHRFRQGYGRAMVEYLAAIAEGRDIHTLVCLGNPDLFPHLRSFEQLGFVRELKFLRPNKDAFPQQIPPEEKYFPIYAPLPLQIPTTP